MTGQSVAMISYSEAMKIVDSQLPSDMADNGSIFEELASIAEQADNADNAIALVRQAIIKKRIP
jgi:hypothetical protein